jgi:hypothetical protein
LALNNFSTENEASHLLSTVLQNMLPSINVHTVSERGGEEEWKEGGQEEIVDRGDMRR